MEATLLFAPGTPKTHTTSDIFVDGLDVYELRGNLRGTATAYRSDGYPSGREPSDITLTSDLKKRAISNKESASREGFFFDGDTWITGGAGALYRSTDRGKSWKAEKITNPDEQIIGVVRHGETLVVAGMDGFLAALHGKNWKPIERPKATRVPFSGFGTSEAYPKVTLTRLKAIGEDLFVLGHGVWKVDAKKAKAELVAPSKELIIDLSKTAKGTLLAVGMKGTVLRREGKKWQAGASGKDPLVGVAAAGDSVVLVSTRQIAISNDDGKSFKALAKQPKLDHALARYNVAVADGHGGVLVAGWRGLLVRVSNDGLGAWSGAKPKKKAPLEKAAKAAPAPHAKPRAKNAKEESKFLADIIANPTDDGPRLIYADWLTEHGDPRGELIQLQCLLKQGVVGATTFNLQKVASPHPDHLALGKRQTEIMKKHAKDWLAPIRKFIHTWAWKRGFLEEVTGNASIFPGLKAILSTHPVAKLSLTGLKKGDLPAIAKLDLGPVRCLDIQSLRIGPKDVAPLLERNMADVEVLLLSGNPIGDEGLSELISKGHFDNLRHLAIAGCGITPAGLEVLAASKKMPNLAFVNCGRFGSDRELAAAGAKLKKRLKPGYDHRSWEPHV